MRKFFPLLAAICLLANTAHAQDVDTTIVKSGTWKYAFSQEGRRDWKPEFTLRYSTGFVTSGPALTAGVRIDDKRTLGIWLGHGETYIDAAPGTVDAIQTAAYMRRYIHLGSRDIFALYGEAMLGCGWVYQVNGDVEQINDSKGDVDFFAGIHAGIRLRIYRNIHIFLGPTLTTGTMGVHAGIGF